MNNKRKNFIGKVFGFLEVISEAEKRHGMRYVTCKCHRCGRTKEICLNSLRRGITTSCGCGHRKDLVGQRFGMLTVIAYVPKGDRKRTHWLCMCDCGRIKEIEGYPLTTGRIKTCGRHPKSGEENPRYKHGLTNCRIMKIWTHMKGRCYNSHSKAYKNYGGRGIKVCDEWLHDVKSFEEWSLSHGYAENLSIDRIDVNGDYTPENCRWTDKKTQCNNQRNNHYIIYKGEKLTIAQIAEKYNLNAHRIVCRISTGWDEIEAIEAPKGCRIHK